MSKIEKLTDKAYTKLNSSRALYNIGNYGDSASMAYYSMFLMAKALLNKIGLDAKTHKGLIGLFYLNYVIENNFDYNIYKSLATCQSTREDADYGISDDITSEIAEELIFNAEEFIREAEKFL